MPTETDKPSTPTVRGRILVLIGASGTGKTTLIKEIRKEFPSVINIDGDFRSRRFEGTIVESIADNFYGERSLRSDHYNTLNNTVEANCETCFIIMDGPWLDAEVREYIISLLRRSLSGELKTDIRFARLKASQARIFINVQTRILLERRPDDLERRSTLKDCYENSNTRVAKDDEAIACMYEEFGENFVLEEFDTTDISKTPQITKNLIEYMLRGLLSPEILSHPLQRLSFITPPIAPVKYSPIYSSTIDASPTTTSTQSTTPEPNTEMPFLNIGPSVASTAQVVYARVGEEANQAKPQIGFRAALYNIYARRKSSATNTTSPGYTFNSTIDTRPNSKAINTSAATGYSGANNSPYKQPPQTSASVKEQPIQQAANTSMDPTKSKSPLFTLSKFKKPPTTTTSPTFFLQNRYGRFPKPDQLQQEQHRPKQNS